jgi:uncharacterized protein YbaA (DUF1428 family)
MAYVDGFVLPIPKKKINDYRRIAKLAGKVWMDHGALDYKECIIDDVKPGMGVPFTKTVKMKPGDTVAFSWILYTSKAHRNAVNKKVMKDPRIANMDHKTMPMDPKRMAYGGFKVLVDGKKK